MKLEHESHQLHFFSNNNDIEANSLFVSAMTQNLSEHLSLVPNTGREFEPMKGLQRDFLVLTTPDGKTRIEFPSNETVIFKEGGTLDEFQELCIKILSSLNKLFPMKHANRLSVLTSKFYSGSEENYNNLYRELFTYRSAQPFEWDNRIVQRLTLERSGEKINSISAIRRLEVQGPFSMKGQPKDMIVVDIDTNTIFQNKDFRFSLSNSTGVFEELFSSTHSVSSELSRYFG
ncbi:TPA: hypothetical protein N2726_004597 [Vibrio parahaemolyticus]|nr:hypothetical protein [Vibrio parahaemolyticus]HCG6864376.1 hypothetical protein [Vibrio parahaemolyticus]HCG8148814.1 hypothetical protein [Vibrio parahaemolyticus]HCH0851488.1 hypothetical protein [Vibrio parahaemolyticus]HCH3220181.1 hypothetical protein [Vibrio parahaemolyticus]